MKPHFNYIEINKKAWNQKTDVHFNSDFYDLKSFLKGHSSLNEIELILLGNIKGKSLLHLQCHFGQDTLSLQRLGAFCTGVDFSDKAIKKAEELALQIRSKARFICCDIYDLPQYLNEKYDLVYSLVATKPKSSR